MGPCRHRQRAPLLGGAWASERVSNSSPRLTPRVFRPLPTTCSPLPGRPSRLHRITLSKAMISLTPPFIRRECWALGGKRESGKAGKRCAMRSLLSNLTQAPLSPQFIDLAREITRSPFPNQLRSVTWPSGSPLVGVSHEPDRSHRESAAGWRLKFRGGSLATRKRPASRPVTTQHCSNGSSVWKHKCYTGVDLSTISS